METAKEICGLLAEQRAELEQFEAETARIISCDIDDIERCVEARQTRIDTLTHLEKKLCEACGQREGAPSAALYCIAKNQCDRALLSGQEAAIYDAGEQAMFVAARIRAIEPQCVARVEREKDTLVETIKAYNRSTDLRMTHYFDTAGVDRKGGALDRYGKA